MDSSSSSASLHDCLTRWQAGDLSARDELFRRLAGRLEGLTRGMLRRFPGVKRWDLTDDVFQSALIRLLRALGAVRPGSARELLALAAEQVRRELIDLARRYYGPQGLGANHASRDGQEDSADPLLGVPDRCEPPESLALWCEFHEQVRALPAEEREVVDLLYYQELTQAEAAALLQVTVRTVQRRWQSALVRLHTLLAEPAPEEAS
jgi:RNA polymerase sigma-70 factor (ECF subfamily)